MLNEEAIAIIQNEYKCVDRDCNIERSCGKCDLMMPSKDPILEAYKLAIKALEQTTWILCSERLPNEEECRKNNRMFNVTDGDRSYSEWFDIRKGFGEPTMYGFRIDRCVIAWQPLPEPYKESKV